MGVKQGINDSKVVILGLLTIGLIGLLFLIVYGNLSGNLGFASDSGTFTIESINLTTTPGNTPSTVAGKINVVLSGVTVVYNNGTAVPSAQYTVNSGFLFADNTSVASHNQDVNVSATYTADSTGEQQTEQVIGNLTGGVVSFFSFSNVWFILGAIALLIAIIVGIIFAVTKIGGSKFSN